MFLTKYTKYYIIVYIANKIQVYLPIDSKEDKNEDNNFSE